MTQKAIQQLIVLWLNIVSVNLNLSSLMFIQQFNITMSLSEVISWIEETILNDVEANMETAKNLADELNNVRLRGFKRRSLTLMVNSIQLPH